jgi:hypothetical protein
MSWGPGPEATLGQTIFLACICVILVVYVFAAMYFVGLYVVQRRNLYISYRCPELLIIEVLINALAAVMVVAREVMALNPPGHRLSCTATRFFTLLLGSVTETSQVRRDLILFFAS